MAVLAQSDTVNVCAKKRMPTKIRIHSNSFYRNAPSDDMETGSRIKVAP